MYKVKCNKDDAPSTIYASRGTANRVARTHARNNSGHRVKVQKVEAKVTIINEYDV